MRRGVGIHGLDKQKRHREGFQKAGEQLAAQQLETMGEQLSKFKSNLHQFACKYKQDIAKDAVFRRHFQQLCTQVGVDPLASNKGFWASMLGIGDFYYELAVQIIQICIETRDRNGGLLALDELSRLLVLHRGQNSQMISEDDILQSIKRLKPLGSGFDIISAGGKRMVQSVPHELNNDSLHVLALTQDSGYTNAESIVDALKWEMSRAQNALVKVVDLGYAHKRWDMLD